MPPEKEDPIEYLKQSELFAGLLEDDYELLRPGLQVRRYHAGTPLFYENDEAGSAYVIVEGAVSIERTVELDKVSETIQFAIRGPGEIIGELSLFTDAPRNADAKAIDNLILVQIRGRHVLQCAQQSPELALALIKGLAKKLHQATNRRMQARVSNVRSRLLETLHEEARLHGIEEIAGVRIPLSTPQRKLTQSELGVRAGCDRAVVNRTLAELVDEGIVEKDRLSILVRHTQRTRAVAGTLLRTAQDNHRAGKGSLLVPEKQLRLAPKLLSAPHEVVQAEIDRLVQRGLLNRNEEGVRVTDEQALAKYASGTLE